MCVFSVELVELKLNFTIKVVFCFRDFRKIYTDKFFINFISFSERMEVDFAPIRFDFDDVGEN